MSHGIPVQKTQPPTRSPRLLSLFLLVLTALIAGFVTPLASTTPAQAATPVTQTIYVVYASRDYIPNTEVGKNGFLQKQYLDALIQQVSDYWHEQTNGAIDKFQYDWNEVKTLQVPEDMQIWEPVREAADYYGLSRALFPNVQATGHNATQILTLVNQGDYVGIMSGISSGNGSTPSLSGSGALRTNFYRPEQGGASTDPTIWASGHRWVIAHEIGHNLGLMHALVGTCEGTDYDWSDGNPERCGANQADMGDLMTPNDLNGPLAQRVVLSPISWFRRSELGLLDSGGRLSVSDGYSSNVILTSKYSTDASSIYEVRVTDPSNPSAIYSIQSSGPSVRVYRVLPLTGMPASQTALLQPTLVSQGGAKGSDMKSGDSFTSASGNVSFTVVSNDGSQAVIQLNVTSVLSVSTTTMVAPPDGHNSLVGLISSTMSWDATSSEWITVSTPSDVGGTTLEYYKFEPNLTSESRSGTITVTTSSGVSRTIHVTQDPVVLNVSQSQWSFSDKGGSLPIAVTASSAWRVSIPSSDTSWLTSDIQSRTDVRSLTSYIMNLTTKANTTGQVRSTIVTIEQPISGYSHTITVTQVPPDCGASISSYCSWSDLSKPIRGMVDSRGDKDWYRFIATSSGAWTFTSSVPTSSGLSDPYGALYDSSGRLFALDDNSAGNRQFLVQAPLQAGQTYFLEVKDSSSSSTGVFTVTATKVLSTLTVDPSSVSISAAGGASPIKVMSNTFWTVSVSTSDSTWLSYTSMPGYGNGVVNIVAQANTGGPRTGVVTVTTTAGTPPVSKTVTVTQAAADCGASTSQYCMWSDLTQPISGEINPGGDRDWYRFVAPSSGIWTFTSSIPSSGGLSDPFGTIYDSKGKTPIASNDDGAGNRQFLVKVQLTQGQTYYLEVRGYSTANTGQFTVTATPPAQSRAMTVSMQSWDGPARGETQTISISSDDSWSVAYVPSWVTINPGTETNEAVTVTMQPNTTGKLRMGVIMIKLDSETDDPADVRMIQVSQSA